MTVVSLLFGGDLFNDAKSNAFNAVALLSLVSCSEVINIVGILLTRIPLGWLLKRFGGGSGSGGGGELEGDNGECEIMGGGNKYFNVLLI